MYNDKYIKTKTKIYNDGVYTNFQHKIPKDNEYCLQIPLEECKYAIKNLKNSKYN